MNELFEKNTPEAEGVTVSRQPDILELLEPRKHAALWHATAASNNEWRETTVLPEQLSFTEEEFFSSAWPAELNGLTEGHRSYLQARANSPWVVNMRGTISVSDKDEKFDLLQAGGFNDSVAEQLSRKGGDVMLIPLYSVAWGTEGPVLTQARADNPRQIKEWKRDAEGNAELDTAGARIPVLGKDGKQKIRSLKFEVPAGVFRGSDYGDLPADVHPIAQSLLADYPMTVLGWTEGAMKGDAILSQAVVEGINIVPVSLTGVTMGYHKAESGTDSGPRLTDSAAAFDHRGHFELLFWDADWRTNPNVFKSLLTFGALLQNAGATVWIVDTPSVTKDGKGGIDDYLAHQVAAKAANPLGDLLKTRIISLTDVLLEAKEYSMDDVGRSERLADTLHARGTHAFDTATQLWNAYDPSVGTWGPEMVDVNVQQVAKMLTERDAGDSARFANSRSGRAISNAVSLAAHDPRVQIRSDAFDLDPFLLNTRSGVVDLRTGEVLAHSPFRRMRKVTTTGFDANAMCPTFDAFILQCVEQDEEYRDFLQRFFGMALIGKVVEEVMGFITGGGRNGKSTMMNTLQKVLGPYAKTFPAKGFTGSMADEMLIELLGVRLAVAAETGAGNALDEQALKTVTSSDTISGRALYQNRVTFDPTASFVLLTNHRPSVRANDEGTWRRMRIMPFDHTVTDAEKDTDLGMKLEAESAGILRWLVEGCLKFQTEGLGTCEVVKKASEQYRTDQDLVGLFMKEKLVTGLAAFNASVKRSLLKYQFDVWCEEQGRHNKWSLAAFREALQERGVLARHDYEKTVRGYPTWYGIGLLPEGQGADEAPTD